MANLLNDSRILVLVSFLILVISKIEYLEAWVEFKPNVFVDLSVTSSQTPQSVPQPRTRQPRPGVQRSEYQVALKTHTISHKFKITRNIS